MKKLFILSTLLLAFLASHAQEDDRGYIVKVGQQAPDIDTYIQTALKRNCPISGVKRSCSNSPQAGAECAGKKCPSSKKTFNRSIRTIRTLC